MKHTTRNLCIAALVWLSASSAMGAGLINGSFEAPPIAYGAGYTVAPVGFGWTIASGNIELLSSAYWQPSNGNQSIDLNGSTTGSIYQDFIFSSSQTWVVKFDMSANPDLNTRGDSAGSGLKSMRVDFGTPGLMTTLGTYSLDSAPRTIANMQYVSFSTPEILVSDSVVYRLQFTSLVGGINGPVLDNVQLQVVPEPSAAALLCSSLVGFIALRRRNDYQD